MTLRLPTVLAFGAVALLTLDACGPKRRGAKHGGGEGEEPAASSGGGDAKNDHFDQQVAKARVLAPQLSKGAVVVLRFFNPTNNFRASMIFADRGEPEKKESGRFLVLAEAKGESDALLATVTILHRNWRPGSYQCDNDTMIAFGISDHWDPTATDTYVSSQAGAHCTMSLQEGKAPGDLEGTITGEFVTNAGNHKLVVQSGYIYVKQFQ